MMQESLDSEETQARLGFLYTQYKYEEGFWYYEATTSILDEPFCQRFNDDCYAGGYDGVQGSTYWCCHGMACVK